MDGHAEVFQPGGHFPQSVPLPRRSDVLTALLAYGVEHADTVALIDSTRDETDIRLNYIIDRKWVLRYCGGTAITEKRLSDLSRLISRYRAFGLQCPQFLPDGTGRYLRPWGPLQCYLSEYIDLPVASEREIRDESPLLRQVQASVAGFAQRYRNVDLSDTMGMYSLFDLSPFDLPLGMDEKEQNFRQLTALLRREGENALADGLTARHALTREKLKSVYRGLPRCVFQGDENFTNILIDENENFAGLIDFNLAGTEVIVNQLANLAGFDYDEQEKAPVSAAARLAHALKDYQEHMRAMLHIYRATETERQALVWYAWIVMIAQWPTVCYFKTALGGALRAEILDLLRLIGELPEERLAVAMD